VTLILNVKTLEDDEPADAGKKKLVITEEHFQRVTQALVMKLRQHEESLKKDGTIHTYVLDFALLSSFGSIFVLVITVPTSHQEWKYALVSIKKTIPNSITHLNLT
jgi:hypothetical protein